MVGHGGDALWTRLGRAVDQDGDLERARDGFSLGKEREESARRGLALGGEACGARDWEGEPKTDL